MFSVGYKIEISEGRHVLSFGVIRVVGAGQGLTLRQMPPGLTPLLSQLAELPDDPSILPHQNPRLFLSFGARNCPYTSDSRVNTEGCNYNSQP